MTFDSLLAAVLFDRMGDVDAAHASIPIKSTDGLFHASSMVIDPQMHGSVSIAASMRAEHDLPADLFPTNRKGRIYTMVSSKRRRQFGNVLSTYGTVLASKVCWIVDGDREKIKPLLSDLCFIGKKRSSGFGEVCGWDVESTDKSPLLDEDGGPRRPIPEYLFTGDETLPREELTWRPAYWNLSHRAVCYAPTLPTSQTVAA